MTQILGFQAPNTIQAVVFGPETPLFGPWTLSVRVAQADLIMIAVITQARVMECLMGSTMDLLPLL